MPHLQRTIGRPVSLEGVGLHTGEKSVLTFTPASADSGYTIIRKDLPGEPSIKPSPEFVSQTERGTTIANNGVEVHTIEHVLAALAGLQIDNCQIELSAAEPPIMDGSAFPFAKALVSAGIVEIPGSAIREFAIQEISVLQDGLKTIAAWPAAELRFTYCLEYDHQAIPSQRIEMVITPESFMQEIAPCRTFCLEREITWLKSKGLAQGGNLQNALVIGDSGLLNPPFRKEKELALHKMLDLLGDLALLGCRLRGHIVASRTGHEMNARLVRDLIQRKKRTSKKETSTMIIEAKDIEKILPHRFPMLLVDRIIDLEEGKKIVGIKNVTMNEHFFQGHFPGHPIMPGVLIVEGMAQCGGVLLFKSVPDAQNKVVYFMAINNVKFRKPVLPGDQLRFELEVEKIRSKIATMNGKAFVGEEKVCEADFMCTLMDK